MREVLEGSEAVARTVALCRPDVVCAYPISPQTHIVEALARYVREGLLPDCEYVNVESEFSAMSVAIGASAAGARTYTATASQGLLYMTEAVFNASGMNLPIVMTIANRAIGAPINIWNDHSDSLALRDCGWLQLFAADNQEAADLHVQAYMVAEQLSTPVMVCMDGFVLTHASDVVDLPTADDVEALLPPFRPAHVLDVDHPETIGMMAGPDTFTETRYLQHTTQHAALDAVARAADEFEARTGRRSGGLVSQRVPAEGPAPAAGELIVLAMGSVLGTLHVVVELLRAEGMAVHLVGVQSYRPFPAEAIRAAVGDAERVLVVDRALAVGIGGVLSHDVRVALGERAGRVRSLVAGLGGRPMPEASLARAIRAAAADQLDELEFLDLDRAAVTAGHSGEPS